MVRIFVFFFDYFLPRGQRNARKPPKPPELPPPREPVSRLPGIGPRCVVVPSRRVLTIGGKDTPFEGPPHRFTIAKPVRDRTARNQFFAEWAPARRRRTKFRYRPDYHGWGRGDSACYRRELGKDAQTSGPRPGLTQKTGRNYRCPSEAEWNMRPRAVTNPTRYSGGPK